MITRKKLNPSEGENNSFETSGKEKEKQVQTNIFLSVGPFIKFSNGLSFLNPNNYY